ncbi:urease-associated protein [Rhizobium sp. Root274]|uniref:lysozyme inhibitor LprI family protein n=1 Tax=unclassified Rhizobium TaxID=2613769 RepID=UPI0007134C9C|nr:MULTISPECIES: lysozyme inhibitor LprI family protein [unclassified Rhizobium]KQW29168.1 urease-associated protein [Rhizobium sp. Root1240]KRD29943.1 urease-associated protein [Rhizobium sp. Root274]
MVRAMNWGVILMLCGCVLLQDAPASGEDVRDVDCNNAQTQADMNQCAAEDYRKADAAMNAQWAETRAAMLAWDKATPPSDANGAAKRLLASQRAWLAYRDAACDVEGYSAEGGSMQPLMISSCLAELTKRRTEELKSLVGLY